jgi:glucokinase
MSAREAVGVDLGGTKVLIGVLSEEEGVVYRRFASPRGLDQDGVLDLVEAEIRAALEERPGAEAIGLGVPCTIDFDRGMCVSAVNLPLREVPLRDIFAERLGLPVIVDNDANVALLAEQRQGAARGATNAVMLTLGTGIGGGLMIDGRIFRGSSGAGAELGHIVVDVNGPLCQGGCPNRGCIETFASGTALARDGIDAAKGNPTSALGRAFAEGDQIDGGLLAELAHKGDPVSIRLFESAGHHLGAALSGLANAFDPDVIVIGGGVMAAGDLLLAPAREEVRKRALPPQNRVPIRPALLGGESGMIGAAALAFETTEVRH